MRSRCWQAQLAALVAISDGAVISQAWATKLRGLSQTPILRILLGSVAGQGVLIAVSPALTRLYTPEDFGALAIVTALSAVLGNLVTLSWERAIVIPADENEAKDVTVLGIGSVFILSLGLGVPAYFMQDYLAALLSSRIFIDFWWLVPVTVASIGFYAIASSCLVRRQQYSGLAIRNAVQGLSQAASSVTLGILGLVPLGLITSVAVGRICGLVGMIRPRGDIYRQRQLWSSAVRYKRFPLVNTWSRMLNSLGLQLPVILIVSLFGSLEAGLYALTLRVLATPVGIVADAVSQYFEGSFAIKYRTKKPGLDSLILKLTSRLIVVGLVPVLVVVFTGPWLFALVFGDEWARAGFFAQLLVFSYYAQFIVSPVSRALVILERQRIQLAWDSSRLIATTSAIVVPWLFGADFAICAIVLAAVQVVWYGILYFLCRRATHEAEQAARNVA